MGGSTSKKTKVEDDDLGSTNTMGQLHPLLIPLVAQKVFSNLDRKDLLTVRRVCTEWYNVGTDTYINRKSIIQYIPSFQAQQLMIKRFMLVMALSPRVPVVRWDVSNVDGSLPAAAFLKFLTFISPSVRGIKIVIIPRHQGESGMTELTELLDTLPPDALPMPELECLEVKVFSGPPPFREAVTRLTHRILVGAEQLRSFCCNFRLEPMVIQELPRGLEMLRFGKLGLSDGATQEGPYARLIDCGFSLKGLEDLRDSLDTSPLVQFLATQKHSVYRVNVDKLEDVYSETHRFFPQLRLVDKLKCGVKSDSTFEFLNAFPNVVELSLRVRCLSSSMRAGIPAIRNDLQFFRQRPTIRKLNISSLGRAVEDLISFSLLGHIFPNVTHLSTPSGGSGRILTDIATHFERLEWLHLDVCSGDPRPREWESFLSGIPLAACEWSQNLNAAGNYRDRGWDVASYGIGLTNLKRLRTVEIGDYRHTFEFLFTELTFRLVFTKMQSLRAICFVGEDAFPQACFSFVERFRRQGIDLYRTKKKSDSAF